MMEDEDIGPRTRALQNAAKSRVLILNILEKEIDPIATNDLCLRVTAIDSELELRRMEQLLYNMAKNGLIQAVKGRHPLNNLPVNFYLAKGRPLPSDSVGKSKPTLPKIVLDDAQLLQQCHEVLKSWKMADEMQAQIATMPNHPFRDQIRGMLSIAERQRDGLIKTIENRAR